MRFCSRLEEISKDVGLDYKTVRIWFCNKRQMVKNQSAKANTKAKRRSQESNEKDPLS